MLTHLINSISWRWLQPQKLTDEVMSYPARFCSVLHRSRQLIRPCSGKAKGVFQHVILFKVMSPGTGATTAVQVHPAWSWHCSPGKSQCTIFEGRAPLPKCCFLPMWGSLWLFLSDCNSYTKSVAASHLRPCAPWVPSVGGLYNLACYLGQNHKEERQNIL